MKKFVVNITETYGTAVIVEAEDAESAKNTVEEMYNNGFLTLEFEDSAVSDFETLREATKEDEKSIPVVESD